MREVKEAERAGKKPKKYNLQSRHFTFYATYYNAMKLLNVRKRGIFVKAVCAYMFEDKPPSFEGQDHAGILQPLQAEDGCIEEAQGERPHGWNPGKELQTVPPMTKQSAPKSHEMLTYEDFRAAYPDIEGNLFGSGQAYESALDWSDVAAKFETDEELRKERNIYYLAKKYEQKYRQSR